MNWKPILDEWKTICASVLGAVASTVALMKLLPKLYGAAKKFYSGTEYLYGLKEVTEELRAEIHRVREEVTKRNLIHQYILGVDEKMGWLQADAKGQFVWANKLWSEWTGLSKEELLGNGWESAIADEDRARVLMDWQTCIDHERPFEAAFAIRNRSGRVRVRMFASPKRDESTGHLELFAGHARIEP